MKGMESEDNKEAIARIYDASVEKEYSRLRKSFVNRVEYELSLDLIREFTVSGDKVIDIGSGPGRYIEPLIKMGCLVGAVDLSGKSIEKLKKTIGVRSRSKLLFAEKKCATYLDDIPTSEFNLAVMFGPLYHLTDKQDRIKALLEAKRVLNKKGKLIITFLSTYPRLQKLLSGTHGEINDDEYVKSIVQGGITYARGDDKSLIPQFRCWPSEAKMLLKEAGFKVLKIRSLEGFSVYTEDMISFLKQDPEKEELFLKVIKSTCEIPETIGATIHFTIVAEPESDEKIL